MAAPAEFVVIRHLLSHEEENDSSIARHVGLHPWAVARVRQRLREGDFLVRDDLLNRLRNLKRKPHVRSYYFRLPNPKNWLAACKGAFLLSGEPAAAELDGYNLVPGQFLAYVPPGQLQPAIQAVRDVFGSVAPPDQANFILRPADPWLDADEEHPQYVERGQRLLDYEENRRIQLLRRLMPRA